MRWSIEKVGFIEIIFEGLAVAGAFGGVAGGRVSVNAVVARERMAFFCMRGERWQVC